MPAKRALTDKTIKKLAKHPAKPGKRYDVMDALVPGFGIRVSDRAHLTYFLGGRFPNSKHYTRREIAEVGALTLPDARRKARTWIEWIKAGKDPGAEQERVKREQARKQAHTFESVCEAFIAEWVIGPDAERPRQRRAKRVAHTIRNQFVAAWRDRPISDISRDDVLAIIKAKARTAPAEARNLLTTVKSIFQWALDQGSYGLDRSICADIKPTAIVGEKVARDRALDDIETAALWNAVAAMPYPVGAIYRLLILSGLRLNEVARATWPEIDIGKREWTIPASRMKGKNHKARPHLVPLTPEIMEVLEDLPRFNRGDFLFSTTHGVKAVSIGSRAKDTIDAAMLEELRKLAKGRGDDPRKVKLAPWVTHDIRRTVRSNLAKLKIAEEVSEAILAHMPSGIKATYNVHKYADEKRGALEAWAARLREIVSPLPPPDNVVRLARA